MILTPTSIDLNDYPAEFHSVLTNAKIYDSSCSPEAKVIFIDKDGGYFLKSAAKGTLEKEAVMTKYFHNKGLSARVLEYASCDDDWLLTEKIHGEDCVAAKYLEQPERLCDTMAELLLDLHSMDFNDCPVPNYNADYVSTARRYAKTDADHKIIDIAERTFEANVLLHGDYCLPNIILKDWAFSGFIDLGCAGVGDRQIDIFWGAWTLNYNLKTDKYRERFYEAYGRTKIDEEKLKIVYTIEKSVGL